MPSDVYSNIDQQYLKYFLTKQPYSPTPMCIHYVPSVDQYIDLMQWLRGAPILYGKH